MVRHRGIFGPDIGGRRPPSIFQKLKGKIGKLFAKRPKAPQPPQAPSQPPSPPRRQVPTMQEFMQSNRYFGHGGIAAGDVKERERRAAAGEQVFTLEEMSRWRQNIGPVLAYGFLYEQQPFFVNSSNVDFAIYDCHEHKLSVTYKPHGKQGSRSYEYSNVSDEEAMTLLQAASKGSWTWDTLRIRGTAKGHKKPYRRIS